MLQAPVSARFIEALRPIANLALPPGCAACGRAIASPGALCPACWQDIQFVEPPLCDIYGIPFGYDMGPGIVSAAAMADPPPFERARAAVLYGPVARMLVHRLKYRDRPEVADMMARAMLRAGAPLIEPGALLVAVPLHRWRLWTRRYNQSAALAERLSRLSGLPAHPLALQRIRSTRQQVGLSRRDRDANVRGAFRVPEAALGAVAGRPIVLVDDVYTSAATVKAATRALKRAGAGPVNVLTFARVAG
jgi:ComF family protein